jgi:hypothetical protein
MCISRVQTLDEGEPQWCIPFLNWGTEYLRLAKIPSE